ncbi:Rnh202p [Lachancea thermotolerans CBS 6340]|uniref:Ribonuclease H2 subunit B n=1 Tax=Lachancea thermotolerans (strain ATCC 56472 / CBS 6340 / NRRL Y-8284) TaxID=559295 RepID=C5DM79_LACTC|nr:KLTH0G06666p [Lachancea thermotolerans CBS 6340]CAR24890.1 KLTH0G06666p [Lachancea thermotolerans CBS 6340]
MSKRIIALSKECNCEELHIFELPHSTNINSKSKLRLFCSDDKIYQIKRQMFSKGCAYNKTRDASNEKYHYCSDSKPLKSGILTNADERRDGWLLEDGYFEFTTKYDLCFSLCGALFSKAKSQDENEYQQEPRQFNELELESRFLMTRDLHETLIDNHDKGWSNIPTRILQNSLQQLCDTIEEGGDTYYKMTPSKITKWLANKAVKVSRSLPASIPLQKDLPEQVAGHAKLVFACNILISLVPQPAYQNLIQYSDEEVNFAKAFQEYRKYLQDQAVKEREQQLQINAAMKVGMGNGNTKKKALVTKRPVVTKKVTKVSKGAIDGFFSKKK